MAQVDPSQFIISRKRKKYRFALFYNSPLCFEFEEWSKKPIDVLEIGAGTGLFSVELAAQSPDKTFLALDVKGDRLQKGARMAEDLGLENVFFLRARADQLPEIIDKSSLNQIWITFPDPFPKKGSAGRRLTHPNFLRIYQNLLLSDGGLLLKHDSLDFFTWSLEQLVANKWQIKELSFNLHESELPDSYKIMTTYEQRWMDEGSKINFLKAKKEGV